MTQHRSGFKKEEKAGGIWFLLVPSAFPGKADPWLRSAKAGGCGGLKVYCDVLTLDPSKVRGEGTSAV